MPINLGLALPTDYKFGNAAVIAIYFGITQVWPAAVTTKLAISRNNGSPSSFTGNGTSGTPFYRANYGGAQSIYYESNDGISHYSWTLTVNGTVYMSCNIVDGTDGGGLFYLKKNGTTFATSASFASSLSGNVAGNSGDVFTIVPQLTDAGTQEIYNVSVYAT